MKQFSLRTLLLALPICFIIIVVAVNLLPLHVPKPPKYNRPIVESEAIGIAKWVANENGIPPHDANFMANRDGTNWSIVAYPKGGPPGTQKYIKLDQRGKLIEVLPGL